MDCGGREEDHVLLPKKLGADLVGIGRTVPRLDAEEVGTRIARTPETEIGEAVVIDADLAVGAA